MLNKHYEVILAWARGETVQWQNSRGEWNDCEGYLAPTFDPGINYRVKPHPTVDYKVRYVRLSGYDVVTEDATCHNPKAVLCGFTFVDGMLKVVNIL